VAYKRVFTPEELKSQIEETRFWWVRSYVYDCGRYYTEYISKATVRGVPLVNIVLGRCPETGKFKMAKGIIAIGRKALGVIAIGQLAIGVIPIGQLAIGLLFSLGQAALALVSIGQLAIGPVFALGQFAVGYIAIGQIAVGVYALGQFAFGELAYGTNVKNPEALEWFRDAMPFL